MKNINENDNANDGIFGGADCGCTEQKTLFFSTLAEALGSAAPVGSSIKPIGFDNTDVFLRAGYRLVESEQDVTVARGGEREFALAREKAQGSKLITVPTHAYAAAAASVYRTEDKAFAKMQKCAPPYAAVFDAFELDANAASVFGEIVALDLCAFDMVFASRMRGDCVNTEVKNRVAELVSNTTNKLRAREKDRRYVETVLVDAGKTAAAIVADCPELLHCSGAAQTAEALRMLYSAEDRPLAMRGETEAVLADAVCDFYIKNISDDTFRFPPDNNRRIDSVCEYFGTDIRHACIHAAPIYPPLKMRLYEYRRNEFRAETASLLADVKSRQRNAAQVFKRLYADDGYAMRSIVDKTDLGICIALAPDVFDGDSMLSFLKQTGKLEEYLI